MDLVSHPLTSPGKHEGLWKHQSRFTAGNRENHGKPQQKTIVDLPRDAPIPTRLQHHPCQATTVPIQLS